MPIRPLFPSPKIAFPRARKTDLIGQVLRNRYELLAVMGGGAMGVVYRARDRVTGGDVAIEVMHPPPGGGHDFADRFVRDAMVASMLDSPFLVPIYGVGSHGDRPYIVMKLLEGETLASRLARRPNLAPSAVCKIVDDVISGLAYLHDRQVVHRALSPANIFLTSDGHVALIHLGVAFRNSPGTIAADLLAAGLVLARALLGLQPDGPAGVPAKLSITDDLTSSIAAKFPALAGVVERALRWESDQRFRSAQQMQLALRAAIIEMTNRPTIRERPPLKPTTR